MASRNGQRYVNPKYANQEWLGKVYTDDQGSMTPWTTYYQSAERQNPLYGSALTLPSRLGWSEGLNPTEVAAIISQNQAAANAVNQMGGVGNWIAATQGGKLPQDQWLIKAMQGLLGTAGVADSDRTASNLVTGSKSYSMPVESPGSGDGSADVPITTPTATTTNQYFNLLGKPYADENVSVWKQPEGYYAGIKGMPEGQNIIFMGQTPPWEAISSSPGNPTGTGQGTGNEETDSPNPPDQTTGSKTGWPTNSGDYRALLNVIMGNFLDPIMQKFPNSMYPAQNVNQALQDLYGNANLQGLLGNIWAGMGGDTSSVQGILSNPQIASLLGGQEGQYGVSNFLNQILQRGLPGQSTIEGLVGSQTGLGTDVQGRTADRLMQALSQGGLTPEYVQAMREMVLQPSQEALSGELNRQGGGVASASSGLFQELQRRNERDFNNQLIAQGMGQYANLLGQAANLGQTGISNAMGAFGNAAGQFAPYAGLASSTGLNLAQLLTGNQYGTVDRQMQLLNSLLGGAGGYLQGQQQIGLGQADLIASILRSYLSGEQQRSLAEYQAQVASDQANKGLLGSGIGGLLGLMAAIAAGGG